jgi:GMP synthase-like glutamine amidotransferase
MRLGILQTGRIRDTLTDWPREYPEMFGELYRAVDPAVDVAGYPVVDGTMPDCPTDEDAWIITGSRHGVYDELPFIEPLKDFLRKVRAAGVPIVGICFGHQIMAEAFGGQASKFEGGWGAGAQTYRVKTRPCWMADAPDAFSMHAMHQDQVVEIPKDATCLASNDFCKFAMLSYGDPATPDAISIQPHPEFDADIIKAILDKRGGTSIPHDRVEPALESLGGEVDNLAFARWSLEFLRQALADRKAA